MRVLVGQHHFTQLHVQLHHLPYHYLMIVVVIIIANTIFFIIIIAIMVTVSRAEACGSKTLPGEDYHSESLWATPEPKTKGRVPGQPNASMVCSRDETSWVSRDLCFLADRWEIPKIRGTLF